jgi:hypothetical protein
MNKHDLPPAVLPPVCLMHFLGALIPLVTAALIAVLGFGLSEVSGPIGSLILNGALGVLLAGVSALTFEGGTRLLSRTPSARASMTLGFCAGVCIAVFAWWVAPDSSLAALMATALLFSAASAATSRSRPA